MSIRDRIKEFKRIPAKQLQPNPKNWRTHPEKQRKILDGVLSEIGYAGALLAREKEDGTIELIDGHLRAETTPDQDVPVLILDLDEKESEKLLAVFDPISDLATKNQTMLNELVYHIETSNESLGKFLGEISNVKFEKEIVIPHLFQIVIECKDETQQRTLYEELSERGVAKIKIQNL